MKKEIILLLIIVIGVCLICGCVNPPPSSSQKLVVTSIQTTLTSQTVLYQDKEFIDTVKSTLKSIEPLIGDMDIDLQYKKMDSLEKDAANLEIQSKKGYDSINSLTVSEKNKKLKEYYLNFLYNEQKYGETTKLATAAYNQGNEAQGVDILEKSPKYAEDAHFWLDKANNELDRLNG